MKLRPEEPSAEPWAVMAIADFMQLLFASDHKAAERPWILAVDGRSGSGKTTVANLIHSFVDASAVIHTDDVAWHHSFFDWVDLLVEGVLKPVRSGEHVSYQPPGWLKKDRPGTIEIPTGLELVIVEGVGASRSEVTPFIDCSIWVQSDFKEAERRGIARDGGSQEAINFWHEWMSEELEFMQGDRPWERATVVVNGTPGKKTNRDSEIVVSASWSSKNRPRM